MKGFTLIELLVTIAIIGILSAAVLMSTALARSKSIDAAIKQQLTDMRGVAENQYGQGGVSLNPYLTACDPTTQAGQMFQNAAFKSDGTLDSGYCTTNYLYHWHITAPGVVTQVSHSPGPANGGWGAAVKLSNGTYFCVDFTGAATTTASLTLNTANQKC